MPTNKIFCYRWIRSIAVRSQQGLRTPLGHLTPSPIAYNNYGSLHMIADNIPFPSKSKSSNSINEVNEGCEKVNLVASQIYMHLNKFLCTWWMTAAMVISLVLAIFFSVAHSEVAVVESRPSHHRNEWREPGMKIGTSFILFMKSS